MVSIGINMDEDRMEPLLRHLLEYPGVRVARVPFYNDEPKIFQYEASIQTAQSILSRGFGSDFVPQRALHKAVCEAVERGCLSTSANSVLIKGMAADLPGAFVEPQEFQPFTSDQLDSEFYRGMRVSR